MREILFRAKTVPSPSRGEESSIWVEGDLAVNYWNYCSIKERSKKGKRYIVIPSTIRQFTGLYDAFENRIFEGDIVDGIDGCDYPMSKGVVAFDQGCFNIYHTDEAEKACRETPLQCSQKKSESTNIVDTTTKTFRKDPSPYTEEETTSFAFPTTRLSLSANAS